jgi:triacylglycerol lipase
MPLEPRELPPPSAGRLLFPARYEYPHFLNAAAAPFDVAATGFSRTHAWWLAEAALLAYWPSDGITAALAKRFGDGVAYRELTSGNVEGYVASFPAFAIVAFRGTEADSLSDMLTDITFAKKPWRHGGQVHQGFHEAFDKAWTNEPALPADRPVFFTGHSLGGAIATLVADAFCHAHGARYGGVYTFGSPLVGDGAFADGFNGRHAGRSYRVVNDRDGVALVPPRIFRFRHVDEERVVGPGVDDATQELEDAGKLDLLKRFGGREALVDHTPSRYAILCWNALVEEQRR